MNETSKAVIRRLQDVRYANTYFVGDGVDIGCGPDPLSKFNQQFPLMTSLKAWDLQDGDAQLMASAEDNSYNFVHSSHCLEHLYDPYEAFDNWIRICKPGGHIITTIPDEDLYEQGVWPSTHNPDHKTSWTISKDSSWSPASINLLEFLYQYKDKVEILKVELVNSAFIYGVERFDQTYHHISECAIEFIVRKRTDEEIKRLGRLPV
jgi:ubiquinone/menaquinone biosynthesis C-methylase UbiE